MSDNEEEGNSLQKRSDEPFVLITAEGVNGVWRIDLVNQRLENPRPLILARHPPIMSTPVNPVPTPEESRAAGPRRHRLRFVCVNDVYSFGGSPRVVKRLRRAGGRRSKPDGDGLGGKETDGNTAVIAAANGDVLGGSSLLVNCDGSVAIESMNSILIDVAVLGNHKFNYGDEAQMVTTQLRSFLWTLGCPQCADKKQLAEI